MKKIIIVFLAVILFALTLTSCSGEAAVGDAEEFSGFELVEWGESNRLSYFSLETLEKNSDLILVGKFDGDASQDEVYQYDDNFQKDLLTFVKSKNDVEVLKVYGGDINVGDRVTVTQYYGTYGNELVTDSKLTPMLKGDTWLFFLRQKDDGTYSCVGDNDGRYPLKNTEYRKIALTENEDLGVYKKEDFREDIYEEILEKYDFE